MYVLVCRFLIHVQQLHCPHNVNGLLEHPAELTSADTSESVAESLYPPLSALAADVFWSGSGLELLIRVAKFERVHMSLLGHPG